MKIHILTIFPNMFNDFLSAGLVGKAIENGKIEVTVHDMRDYSHNKHRMIDDMPYGGGAGLVMKPVPFFHAVKEIFKQKSLTSYKKGKFKTKKVVCFSPKGRRLDQTTLKKLKGMREIVLFCGRYEGIDERVVEKLVDEEVSMGDFVIQGGELPSMIFIEGLTRLIPGVIAKEESYLEESFEQGLLEYPQYTRPAEFAGMKVPDVLLSGDHGAIKKWRDQEAVKRTLESRPDMIYKKIKPRIKVKGEF